MERRLAGFFGSGGAPAQRGPTRTGERRIWRGAPERGPRLGIAAQPLPRRDNLIGRREGARETIILAILINHPDLLERHIEEIAALDIDSPRLSALREAMLSLAARGLNAREGFRIGPRSGRQTRSGRGAG